MRPRLFLLAFALFASAACHKPEAAAVQKEDASVVRAQVATIGTQPMPEYLTLTGTLRASEESDIAADASGKVLATFVERGQSVKKGEVLAMLDARTAALTQTAAQAQAELAKSQLEQAQKDCERVKHLYQTGAISQAEYDRQITACTSGQWSFAAAQAQQESATKMLGDTRIRAPFDGVIGERFVNVGQYVAPSTRVASMYKPDPLRLELTVPEAQVGALKPDMTVTFKVAAFGDDAFKGTVKFISPNVRTSTRDLVIEAVVPNAEMKLRPGMFAVAKLPLGEPTSPVVPASALARDDTSTRLFVVEGGRVQERLVQTAEEKDGMVAIAKGAKAGEQYVVQPTPDVRDGVRVDATSAPAPQSAKE